LAKTATAAGPRADWLNAASESEYRIDLWRRLWSVIDLHALEGWGWIGVWTIDLPPFVILRGVGGSPYRSALNGFMDAWLQLGAVGAALLILLMGLTFVRTWILASRKATSTIVWGALIMVALVCVSLAESDVISGMGWFVLVVCSVRAAHQLSWRGKFAERP
jgi:O-antigen ligase